MTKPTKAQQSTQDIPQPSHNPPSTLGGYLLAGFGAMLFATKGIFTKLAYASGPLSVETLLAWRMLLSVPIFAYIGFRLLVKEPERKQALTPAILLRTFLIGLLGYYLSSWLDFSGLKYLTAQFERLILFTYPLFLVLLGALFFGHKLSKWTFPTFFITYLGLAIIFLSDLESAGPDLVTGSLFVLSSAITFALYQLLAKEMINVMGSRLFTSIAMSAAGIGILAHFLVTNEVNNLILETDVFFYVAMIAIFATVLPAFMINEGLSRIGPQAVSLVGNLGPVFTTILAVLVLDEAFGPPDFIGTLLVLGGIILFSRLQKRG